MNILLLLSALMSAIAGVGAGSARAPVAAAQVVRAGEAAIALAVVPAATVPPVQSSVTVTGLVAQPIVVVPLPSKAFYMSRRRE